MRWTWLVPGVFRYTHRRNLICSQYRLSSVPLSLNITDVTDAYVWYNSLNGVISVTDVTVGIYTHKTDVRGIRPKAFFVTEDNIRKIELAV